MAKARGDAPVDKTEAAAAGQSSQSLEAAIKRLSELSGGVVGVSAIHVESGRRVAFNGRMRFPMASSYKMPIALQLLRRVDRGEVRLDDTITVTPREFRSSYSPLADFAKGKPITLSVERLLELMLGDSDNTASDVILRVAGGPGAVTRRMRELGINDVDVSRSEGEIGAALSGVYELPPEREWSPELFQKISSQVKEADRPSIKERFLKDARDTATPDALAELLVRVHRGETLAPPSTERMLQIMAASPTGPARLKGLLPPGTVVAHKTGTWGYVGTTNDVGIVTLPGDAGHIAIAVLVKASTKDVPERERAIAEIARTIYDYFLLQ
ncbi:MAG TPA: class A beta-lactamase [Pyrinomonadaceae bacterium]|nr:class A beta-lactamase [Pyrinomonadaceae bacterium]